MGPLGSGSSVRSADSDALPVSLTWGAACGGEGVLLFSIVMRAPSFEFSTGCDRPQPASNIARTDIRSAFTAPAPLRNRLRYGSFVSPQQQGNNRRVSDGR